MASPATTLNENIKKKLLALSENIRRNLLQAGGNVQRKYVLEERDLLSILILAIQHLNKQPPQPATSAHSSITEQKKTEQSVIQPSEQNELKTSSEEIDSVMGKGGGKTESESYELDNSERLRKELLRILDSTSFNNDSKSYMIVDACERYHQQNNLTKERKILNSHLKTHPNMMVGGGGGGGGGDDNRRDDAVDVPLERRLNDESAKRTSEQPSTSTSSTAERESSKDIVRASPKTPQTNPAELWINDAVSIITSHMKKRVNIIFLENLQSHASKLRTFLTTKGKFDKDNNRVYAPHNRFFLKKGSLYFKLKSVKHLQSFDLATLLACISLSQSKLFRFLQYRFDKVKAFSKLENQCLTIFLNACPISRQRIPCKAIRNLASP